MSTSSKVKIGIGWDSEETFLMDVLCLKKNRSKVGQVALF